MHIDKIINKDFTVFICLIRRIGIGIKDYRKRPNICRDTGRFAVNKNIKYVCFLIINIF